MEQTICKIRNFLGQQIVVEIKKLDVGYHILIIGGSRTHIGAVSIVEPDAEIRTTILAGHKEQVICERWANEIFNSVHEPVCVMAGVHYDDLTKEQIQEVVNETNELLEECKREISMKI